MNSKNLKAYPEKQFLKFICDVLYYMGAGECWYEERKQSKITRILYNVWTVVVNFFLFSIFFDELFAHLRSDLTSKEKNDLIQFTLAHSSIISKIVMLYLLKGRFKVVMRRFLEDNKEYSCRSNETAAVRKAIKYCAALIITLYFTLFSALLDAIRMHLSEGIPIRTEVVYFPSRMQSGLGINAARMLIEAHWWYLVTIMACIDCLAIGSLVFLGFKYRLLHNYFLGLRRRFLENVNKKSRIVLEEEFKRDFVIGIKLHEDTLWCKRSVQQALGNIYSIQVIESIVLLVFTLIKLVAMERTLTLLMANLTYMSCMIALTGAYMMSAGDIIFEAEMLTTAIFHSGWELARARKELRTLAVVALIRSQVPVYMTAFGIVTLSYNNFISVLRHSYSFFAVMY